MFRPVLVCLALLALATPVRAQEPPVQQEERDPRDRMLERLRAIDAASRPQPPGMGRPAEAGAAPGDSAGTSDGPASMDTLRTRPSLARPAAGVAGSPDSITSALRALEGYVVTEYRAARGHFAADSGRLSLTGKPELSREGQSIRADSLVAFDQTTSIMCGYGKPLIDGTSGQPVQSEQVCFNVETQLGLAVGARTTITEGATWFVHGDTLVTQGRSTLFGLGTEYTSCDLDVPHYHFAAKNVKVIHRELMVARDVTLNFADVPVFWLPFMVQSMKEGRRSGLLTPSFGLTDIVRNSQGYQREIRDVGLYWAINDYMGARAAMGWRSNDYTAADAELQLSLPRQFLDSRLTVRRFWPKNGARQFTVNTSTGWRPDERTSLRIAGGYASSSDYIRRNTFDPRELERSIDSNAGMSRRFSWGQLSLSGQRRQFIDREQVDLTLPAASLSLSPITLFRVGGAEAVWNGSMSANTRRRSYGEPVPDSTRRDFASTDGSLSSSLNFGPVSWSQSLRYEENIQAARPPVVWPRSLADPLTGATVDTFPALARDVTQRAGWSSGFGYTQRLVGTSTVTPTVGMSGEIVKSARTGGEPVASPIRMNVGASVGTNLFGFWRGVGPIGAIRHRIDPSISWGYSPAPQVTALQEQVFGIRELRETNQLTLSISQTWEGKFAEPEGRQEARADSAALAPDDGTPRRMPQPRKVTLLSLSTSALVYDFVRAREGDFGLQTTDLSHTLSSGLVQGLSVNLQHDLFRTEGVGTEATRTFAPRFRQVNANFSLDGNSWMFRSLGLGSRRDGADAEDTEDGEDRVATDPFAGPIQTGMTRRGNDGQSAFRSSDRVGTWRASMNYSLMRGQPGFFGTDSQMLRGSMSFQPTLNWGLNWATSYSFTNGEFSDHVLTLRRDLHDWQANFDFVKAQNGNLIFSFRVELLANPDLRFDYRQRGGTGRASPWGY